MKSIRIKDYYGKYQEIPVDDQLYEEWKEKQKDSKGKENHNQQSNGMGSGGMGFGGMAGGIKNTANTFGR